MKVTCVECGARYEAPDEEIRPEGRTVRCSECGHEWVQLPGSKEEITEDAPDTAEEEAETPPEEGETEAETETEDTADDSDEDEDAEAATDTDGEEKEGEETEEAEETEQNTSEDSGEDPDEGEDASEDEEIPESVKPDHEEDDDLEVAPQREEEDDDPKAPLRQSMGYLAAALVFFLIAGILLLLHTPLARAWPAMAGFYELVGYEIAPPGEGLIFDKVEVTPVRAEDGNRNLEIKGVILNLSEREAAVPMIRLSARKADGTVVDSWVVEPPAPKLPPQEDVSFQTVYDNAALAAKEINAHFVLVEERAGSAEAEGTEKDVE